MIVEIAVVSGLVAAVGAITTAMRRRTARKALPATSPPSSAPRGLHVGDVFLYMNSELWLSASAIVDDDGPALCLYRTPGNPHADWIAILEPAAREVFALKTTSALGDGAPPDSIRLGEFELRLLRRGRATLRLAGEDLPLQGDLCNYAILRGVGGQLAITLDTNKSSRLALSGAALDSSSLDLLPGGDARTKA